MDEILQRMLRVEKEAEQLVREARAQAASIMDQGRRDASELDERAQKEIVAEAENLVETRIEQARQEKQEALAQAETILRDRLDEFRARIQAKSTVVLDVLAFPQRVDTPGT